MKEWWKKLPLGTKLIIVAYLGCGLVILAAIAHYMLFDSKGSKVEADVVSKVWELALVKSSEMDVFSTGTKLSIDLDESQTLADSDQNEVLTPGQLEVVLLLTGWPEDLIPDAIKVAKCESGLRPKAVNTKNTNKTIDRGLFQINSVHDELVTGEEYSVDDLYKAFPNSFIARKLHEQRGFEPWQASHKCHGK